MILRSHAGFFYSLLICQAPCWKKLSILPPPEGVPGELERHTIPRGADFVGRVGTGILKWRLPGRKGRELFW